MHLVDPNPNTYKIGSISIFAQTFTEEGAHDSPQKNTRNLDESSTLKVSNKRKKF